MAIPAEPDTPALADTTGSWEEELDQQVAAARGLIPARALDRARETIRSLASDTTTTMLHRDLHFGNILSANREPWLAVDPKVWRGPAAFDALTVIAVQRKTLRGTADLERAVRDLIRRYASVAGVSADEAFACTQARAPSSYLHRHLRNGDWFDLEFLRSALELRSS